ncbi:uncharacterized protein LOC119794655 [Cyprinodon tularosa]|uniref:uncharacterized protein LOC119794655 n=1 Tax=Cyprinodon tularosa TaxID=77115 RepID=UPI0018E1FF0F|nr:uncharacterized protein LOC119794655 [Cyprinodon tularosa]
MSLISSDSELVSMSRVLNDFPSIKLKGEQERQNHEMLVNLNDRLFDCMSKTSTTTVEFKYEKNVTEKIVELTRSSSLHIEMESSMVKSLEQQISELKRRLEIETKAKKAAEIKIDKLLMEHFEEIKTLSVNSVVLNEIMSHIKTKKEFFEGIIVHKPEAEKESINRIKAMIQRMRESYKEDETDGLGWMYQQWTGFIGATERKTAESLEIEQLKAKIQEMTIFQQKQKDEFKKTTDSLNETFRKTIIYFNCQTKRMQTEIKVYKELLEIMEKRLLQCGGSVPICGLPVDFGESSCVRTDVGRTETVTVVYEEKKGEVECGEKSDAPNGDGKRKTTTPTKPPPGESPQQPKIKKNKK